MTKQTTAYVPGVCNINPTEIAHRRKVRNAGFAVAAVTLAGLLFTSIHPLARAAVVFLPLFVGTIGYLQVKNRFCVSYAATGKQNAAVGSKAASEVASADDHAKDQAKARRMNGQATIIAGAIAAATIALPRL